MPLALHPYSVLEIVGKSTIEVIILILYHINVLIFILYVR